jgi:hypothetical protein
MPVSLSHAYSVRNQQVYHLALFCVCRGRRHLQRLIDYASAMTNEPSDACSRRQMERIVAVQVRMVSVASDFDQERYKVGISGLDRQQERSLTLAVDRVKVKAVCRRLCFQHQLKIAVNVRLYIGALVPSNIQIFFILL